MLKETIEGLAIKPNGVYVDVTFGGGGHSRAILEKLQAPPLPSPQGEGGHLYSFDQDIEAYENAKGGRIISGTTDEAMNSGKNAAEENNEGGAGLKTREQNEEWDEERWTFVHSNFRYLRNWMDYYGVEEIDGLLADLGVSFHHFDCPERGFSFRYSAPLDMRMNQTSKRTAADIVNGYSEEELAKIFWLYGELKNGRGIAKNICKARSQKPILRTEELISAVLGRTSEKVQRDKGQSTKDIVELEIPAQYKKDLARLFQALRIEVNDELGALREMLVAARDLLKPGGRIAILTYHSLEDRLVKNFFRSGNLEGTIEKDFYGNNLSPFEIIEKGREASEEEVARNPRARSAKLRVAEKI